MQADEKCARGHAGNTHGVPSAAKRQRLGVPDELLPQLLVARLDSEEATVQLDADIVSGPVPPLVVTLLLNARRVGGQRLETEPGGDGLRTGQLRRRDEQVDVPVVAASRVPRSSQRWIEGPFSRMLRMPAASRAATSSTVAMSLRRRWAASSASREWGRSDRAELEHRPLDVWISPLLKIPGEQQVVARRDRPTGS